MDGPARMIAAVQGTSATAVQDIFRMLVERWRPSARVAGVIAEGHGLPDRACGAGFLRHIGTGAPFAIFLDSGPGSTACHLDAAGARTAAAAVLRDVAAGCDLVLLSKFGKLEAAGDGLLPAFQAAIDAAIPVLTSVSPAFAAAWARFAAPAFDILPPDPGAIDGWWQAVRSRPAAAGNAPGGRSGRLAGVPAAAPVR